MTNKEIASAYVEAKKLHDIKKAELDELYSAMNSMKITLYENLKTDGLKSARFEDATVTIQEKKTRVIENSTKLINFFKKEKLADYVSEQINDLGKEALAKFDKEALIPGTTIKKTEYVSIKSKELTTLDK